MSDFLKAQEFTNGKDGEIQFIIDNVTVVSVLGSSKFSASTTPKVTERGQIGTRNKQAKIAGFENKITLTADYYLVSVIRGWLIAFRRSGKWPKIDLMAVNEDEGTSLGRMSTLYKDLVLTDEVPIQKLDESVEDGLMIDLNFVFSDWDSLGEFKDLDGVKTDKEEEKKEEGK